MSQMAADGPVAVLGGGSFGTVLANVLAHNGLDVRLWLRDAEVAADIRERRCNSRYFPDLRLHESLQALVDPAQALDGVEGALFTLPSHALRGAMAQLAPLLAPGTRLISTIKGIEHDGFLTMSQVLLELAPSCPIGVLSGPNLAGEIARGEITGTVLASADERLRRWGRRILGNAYFHIYPSTDVIGVELAGALKNIYAIVSGIASEYGVGHNSSSLIQTGAVVEMSRFARRCGANPATFLGLAGLGDLLASCHSPDSRNYRLGQALGRGADLGAAQREVAQTVEGIPTLLAVHARARALNAHMPIVNGLYAMLYEGHSITEVVSAMLRLPDGQAPELEWPRMGADDGS